MLIVYPLGLVKVHASPSTLLYVLWYPTYLLNPYLPSVIKGCNTPDCCSLTSKLLLQGPCYKEQVSTTEDVDTCPESSSRGS